MRRVRLQLIAVALWASSVALLHAQESVQQPAGCWLMYQKTEDGTPVPYYYFAVVFNSDFSIRSFSGRKKNGLVWSSDPGYVAADGAKVVFRDLQRYYARLNIETLELDIGGAQFGQAVQVVGIKDSERPTIDRVPEKMLSANGKILLFKVFQDGAALALSRENDVMRLIDSINASDRNPLVETPVVGEGLP